MKHDCNKKKVLFVCNKGGHYSQMLELKPLMQMYDSYVLTEKQDASKDLNGYADAMSMENYRVMNHILYNFVKSLFKCAKIWRKIKPQYIISTGSAFALPMFLIGKLYGSKLVYIESRARVYAASRTGKQLSKICDKLLVQWPEMKDVYGEKAEYYGILA